MLKFHTAYDNFNVTSYTNNVKLQKYIWILNQYSPDFVSTKHY